VYDLKVSDITENLAWSLCIVSPGAADDLFMILHTSKVKRLGVRLNECVKHTDLISTTEIIGALDAWTA